MRLKLRQVISGFVYNEEGKAIVFDSTKFDLASRILIDLEQNVLIMYQLREELRQFLESKKLKAKLLKKKEDIETWNTGSQRFMAGHPLSMGHGLNLQDGGNNIFWYSLPRSAEQYMQVNYRLRRTGQELPVVLHRILFKNTIDEVIVSEQREKAETQEGFERAIKSYRG